VASQILGEVQTVLGLVEPENLGVTLTHEHLLIDMSVTFTEPALASEKHLAYQPITMQNLGWLRMNYINNLDNCRLLDEGAAVEEVFLFKQNGGCTITEVTPKDMGRNPLGLLRIARATGVNIIMGTAYYTAIAHPPQIDEWTEQQIATEFVNEIMVGVEGTEVRAGIIGEIGCSWPLAKNELKVLRAAALAQQQTGAPLMIHPGRNENAPFEIIDILRDAGADLNHTIICHISRTLLNLADRLKVAEAGCYIGYDMLGELSCYHALAPVDLPSDAQHIDQIRELIAEGYEKQILVSHDVCRKMQLTRYGGNGYSYLLRYGVPWMQRKGIPDNQIHTILIDNPKNALQCLMATSA